MKKLRDYQSEGIDKIFDKLSKGINRQIAAICTGGGKTLLASRVAANPMFNRILFMTHTEELLEQSGIAMLNEFYPELHIGEILNQHGGLIEYFRYLDREDLFVNPEETSMFGIIKADMFKIDAKVTLASYQTLHRRLHLITADHFDLIIIDECHLAGSQTISKTLNYFKPKLLLGLSASPYRNDGANLSDLFDEITVQYSISDAIQEGYLCELDAIQVKTQLTLDDVHTLGGEFNQKELRQEVDVPQRNQLIVDSYKKYADGKQNLVFCVDVQHAQNLCQAFKDAGYRAEFIVGDEELTPDRKAVINRFKSGETQVLTNCMILTAGFDHPGIGCLTLACPTKSLTKFIQQVGRATRTLPGVIDGLLYPADRLNAIKASEKPHCTVLDIVDVSNRHKIINTWSLDKDKPVKDQVFTTTEKKNKLIEVQQKREFDAQTKKDTKVNLFELPKIKFSNSLAMKNPASEKQLGYLKDLGYDVEGKSFTMADATRMISNDAAPMNWIFVLKKKGYNVSNGVTRAEAQKAFEEINIREKKEKEKKDLGNDVAVQGL